MSLEEAFHQPRIDVSGGGQVTMDPLLGESIFEQISAALPATVARRSVFPYAYACPAGVMRAGGLNSGCTEIMSPYGDAVHG
jgi:gamma-glutamyltranspeptidase/glutathione hydrolase